MRSLKIIGNGRLFEIWVTVSYSQSIATLAVSLTVSTQYTNVTDTQPDPAQQQEPRYAALQTRGKKEPRM